MRAQLLQIQSVLLEDITEMHALVSFKVLEKKRKASPHSEGSDTSSSSSSTSSDSSSASDSDDERTRKRKRKRRTKTKQSKKRRREERKKEEQPKIKRPSGQRRYWINWQGYLEKSGVRAKAKVLLYQCV